MRLLVTTDPLRCRNTDTDNDDFFDDSHHVFVVLRLISGRDQDDGIWLFEAGCKAMKTKGPVTSGIGGVKIIALCTHNCRYVHPSESML